LCSNSIRFSKRLLQVVVISLALRPRKAARNRRGWLHPQRPFGRGTLRENGSHGIEYGLMQPTPRALTSSVTPPARSAGRASLRPEFARHRRGVASWQRRKFVAARSDRHGFGRGIPTLSGLHRFRSGFRRRPLDHFRQPLTKRSRPKFLSAALYTASVPGGPGEPIYPLREKKKKRDCFQGK